VSELFAPVCSIMLTKRRRFFWAAWWSGPPSRAPFRRPDASDGGALSFDEARAAAERAAGASLGVLEPIWARAWNRVLRGEDPWPNGPRAAAEAPRPDPRAETPPADADPGGAVGGAPSIWDVLGVKPGVTADDLKLAFRRKALTTHPDQGGEPEAFRQLLRAYEEARRRVRKPKAARRPVGPVT
jgi:hypothetical protein